MTTEPAPISSELIEYLGVLFPTAPRRVRDYQKLCQFGWSHEDIVCAIKTGYNFELHVRTELEEHNWKWHIGPEPFHSWLGHYYRQLQAAKAGIGFDEFVEQWCNLWKRVWLNEHISSRVMLASYVRARRGDIRHNEALVVATHFTREDVMYIALRRKLSYWQTETLVRAYRLSNERSACDPHTKSILEALRRGALFDEVVEHVRNQTVQNMALQLRYAQRAQ